MAMENRIPQLWKTSRKRVENLKCHKTETIQNRPCSLGRPIRNSPFILGRPIWNSCFEKCQAKITLICKTIEPFAEKFMQELLSGYIWLRLMWWPTILSHLRTFQYLAKLYKLVSLTLWKFQFYCKMQRHLVAEFKNSVQCQYWHTLHYYLERFNW